jgi:hypothetical protein
VWTSNIFRYHGSSLKHHFHNHLTCRWVWIHLAMDFII